MRKEHLQLFKVDDCIDNLVFHGEKDNERLANGIITTSTVSDTFAIPAGMVVDGIGFFGKPGDPWNAESIDRMIQDGWINHNWNNENSQSLDSRAFRKDFCDTLATLEGPILEVAAGPGGGNLSPILHRNPSASVIVNDISIRVLRLWHEFLRNNGSFPNVLLAAFDACSMPLRNDCIQAISSSGGFSNINHSERAIAEVYRVLASSGRVFALEATVDLEDWANLPEVVREEIQQPELYSDLFRKAGFKATRKRIGHRRRIDPEESGIATKAAPYGVELHIIFEEFEALKP